MMRVCPLQCVVAVGLAMKCSSVLWQQLGLRAGGNVVFMGWLSILCGCGGSVLFESCYVFSVVVVVPVGGKVRICEVGLCSLVVNLGLQFRTSLLLLLFLFPFLCLFCFVK